ncbi:hypothetical protein [Halobacillus mangrovi]|uniref:hypothetical protein n=1 Tax=Halobacillus mangrovi TaxID=402384 RepID=UPI0018DB9E5B|nr:hypothetical protein [Halobacillus mangrovi]
MRSSKGFTFAETVAAFSIMMVITLAIYPALIEIRLEQKELAIERYAITTLQDQFLLQSESPSTYPYLISESNDYGITILFQKENQFIKGCAIWTSIEQEKQEVCLYALQEQ